MSREKVWLLSQLARDRKRSGLVATMPCGVLIVHDNTQNAARESFVRLSGSTIALAFAVVACGVGVRSSLSLRIPTVLAAWLFYAVYPITAVIAAVWSGINLIRYKKWQRTQFALELLLALALLWRFYIVINSPV